MFVLRTSNGAIDAERQCENRDGACKPLHELVRISYRKLGIGGRGGRRAAFGVALPTFATRFVDGPEQRGGIGRQQRGRIDRGQGAGVSECGAKAQRAEEEQAGEYESRNDAP